MKDWNLQVDSVFSTNPRVGHKGAVWMPRKEQGALREAFDRIGTHACLDGPTGTGKSSLALTHLVLNKIPHATVQVTSNMTWPDFVRQILGSARDSETSLEAKIEIGAKPLPSARLEVTLGDKESRGADAKLLDALAKSWTEHDVAKRMTSKDVTLFVDDVERASGSLIRRLSDLCKILTQSFTSQNGKLLIVGTGDVYRRLYSENSSLEERLVEVSLGVLPAPNDSWSLLAQGFGKLGFYHPGVSRFPNERRQVRQCRDAAYMAADGLPKSLNRLGQQIADRAKDRRGATAFDIIEVSRAMSRRHWDQHSRQFAKVLNCLRQNRAVVEVIKQLYADGVGRIHDSHRLGTKLAAKRIGGGVRLTSSMIETAIDELVAVEFLVRTGMSGEVIFAAHPSAAHTLGVVIQNPANYAGAESLLGGIQQLNLPFARFLQEDSTT